MAQVDSENSTLMPAVSTRRRFLSQAAAVTAGGAAFATALPLPGAAGGSVQALDPILEAIEAHKVAHIKWVSWVDCHCKLESELPAERRCTDTSRDIIVQTDDPRWIEAESQLDLAGDAEIEAAYALIEVIPTTRPGLLGPCSSTPSPTTQTAVPGPMRWRGGLTREHRRRAS